MKKLLLILLCLPMIGFGQQTYVPDDNFEQELINLGYDNVLDNSVTTASIDTVTFLNLDTLNISDLTGIEDFIALTYLSTGANWMLSNIDVSYNHSLTYLSCWGNSLTTLNVNNNTYLKQLICHSNLLATIDVSQNINLTHLHLFANQITNLNLNQNTDLTYLIVQQNELQSLDISNNINLDTLHCGVINS